MVSYKSSLPDLTCGVHCQREDRDEWHILKLDGVHFDWRDDDAVVLTWRVRFPLPEAGDTKLTLTRVSVKPAARSIPAASASEPARPAGEHA